MNSKMKYFYTLLILITVFTSCLDGVGVNNSRDCHKFSECGCTKYNKSDCEKDICCKWKVGKGCGCR